MAFSFCLFKKGVVELNTLEENALVMGEVFLRIEGVVSCLFAVEKYLVDFSLSDLIILV